MLFQPGWTVPTWHFQLDVELLQSLFQLLLVSSVVCSYGIMEQDELVMQNFHLCGSTKGQLRVDEKKRARKPICWLWNVEQKKPPAHLVLFQELQLDRDVVSHPFVLLAVDLELLLGLLDLGHGGGITWPQIQLLQICTVCIILNPRSVSIETISDICIMLFEK